MGKEQVTAEKGRNVFIGVVVMRVVRCLYFINVYTIVTASRLLFFIFLTIQDGHGQQK